MVVYQSLAVLALFTVGYSVGRAGHIFIGGKIDFLHHWVYGILLVAIGIVFDFDKTITSLSFISFGVGCFISDFKDFVHFKFYGRDPPGKKNFFGFD